MQLSNTLSALVERWKREAQQASERFGLPSHAHLILKHVEDLEHAVSEMDNEHLSLTDAANECGYSPDHLGRLVKDGSLHNHGSKHRPKVRRGDLPKKVCSERLQESETTFTVGLTRKQIARAVVNRQVGDE